MCLDGPPTHSNCVPVFLISSFNDFTQSLIPTFHLRLLCHFTYFRRTMKSLWNLFRPPKSEPDPNYRLYRIQDQGPGRLSSQGTSDTIVALRLGNATQSVRDDQVLVNGHALLQQQHGEIPQMDYLTLEGPSYMSDRVKMTLMWDRRSEVSNQARRKETEDQDVGAPTDERAGEGPSGSVAERSSIDILDGLLRESAQGGYGGQGSAGDDSGCESPGHSLNAPKHKMSWGTFTGFDSHRWTRLPRPKFTEKSITRLYHPPDGISTIGRPSDAEDPMPAPVDTSPSALTLPILSRTVPDFAACLEKEIENLTRDPQGVDSRLVTLLHDVAREAGKRDSASPTDRPCPDPPRTQRGVKGFPTSSTSRRGPRPSCGHPSVATKPQSRGYSSSQGMNTRPKYPEVLPSVPESAGAGDQTLLALHQSRRNMPSPASSACGAPLSEQPWFLPIDPYDPSSPISRENPSQLVIVRDFDGEARYSDKWCFGEACAHFGLKEWAERQKKGTRKQRLHCIRRSALRDANDDRVTGSPSVLHFIHQGQICKVDCADETCLGCAPPPKSSNTRSWRNLTAKGSGKLTDWRSRLFGKHKRSEKKETDNQAALYYEEDDPWYAPHTDMKSLLSARNGGPYSQAVSYMDLDIGSDFAGRVKIGHPAAEKSVTRFHWSPHNSLDRGWSTSEEAQNAAREGRRSGWAILQEDMAKEISLRHLRSLEDQVVPDTIRNGEDIHRVMQEWKASSNGDIAKKFDGLLEMTSGLIRGYLAEKVISKIQDPSQSDEEAKQYSGQEEKIVVCPNPVSERL